MGEPAARMSWGQVAVRKSDRAVMLTAAVLLGETIEAGRSACFHFTRLRGENNRGNHEQTERGVLSAAAGQKSRKPLWLSAENQPEKKKGFYG